MASEFRADIHCHTTCSDGSDSPQKVLQLAKKVQLQGLSITDHDTTAAYTLDFFDLAKELEIQILTGVEISTELDGIAVHILGYGCDLENESLQDFLKLMRECRTIRNRLILEKLARKDLFISEEELNTFATGKSIGRPHIAGLMIQKGYVQSLKEAFDFYLKEGASCYAAGPKYRPEEAIDSIKNANGKAILAHPHFYKKGSFVKNLLMLPFDGYECYYSKLDKGQERPWVQRAHERDLIATGGSDYHGNIKSHIPLGCSWVNQHTFDQLMEN